MHQSQFTQTKHSSIQNRKKGNFVPGTFFSLSGKFCTGYIFSQKLLKKKRYYDINIERRTIDKIKQIWRKKMLKNKIVLKKISNIFIVLMVIVIMLGAYHYIRNSKAESVIPIELELVDKSKALPSSVIMSEATETSDGIY